MRYILLVLMLVNISYAQAQDTVDCPELSLKAVYSIPQQGRYIKAKSYHVTHDKYEPRSDQILYHVYAKDIPEAKLSDFEEFFKQYMTEERRVGGLFDIEELIPMLREFLVDTKGWIAANNFDYNLEKNLEIRTQILDVFSERQNQRYVVMPRDAELDFEKQEEFIITLRQLCDPPRLQGFSFSGPVIGYLNAYEDRDDLILKIDLVRNYLIYIKDNIPPQAGLVQNIQTWLELESL